MLIIKKVSSILMNWDRMSLFGLRSEASSFFLSYIPQTSQQQYAIIRKVVSISNPFR